MKKLISILLLLFLTAFPAYSATVGGGGGSGDITDVYDCSSGDCNSIPLSDGDLLDMSSVSVSGTTEGIILPQHATDCSTAGTAEGQVCWEADANVLYVGDGATVIAVGPGAGAGDITDVFDCASGDCSNITVESGDSLVVDPGAEVEATEIVLAVNNDSGATIFACTAVYISGFDIPSNLPEISIADADNAAAMPAIGLLRADTANGANGRVIVIGDNEAWDTSTGEGWSVGDSLYINDSGTAADKDCGNTLTNVRPANTDDNVQKIGSVMRVHATQGEIEVSGANRSNDIPNLQSAFLWVGNATNVGTAVQLSSDVTMDNAGAVTIAANSVALTTDTTGNYADGDAEAGAALTGDTATAFFAAGTIEHERGGLEADINAYDGLVGITGGATFNQTGTTTQIVIFDGAGAPTSAALSGDATMTNAGVVTVVDDLHAHTTTSLSGIVNADLSGSAAITNANLALTAGRSLTETTNDIAADAELYTKTKCALIETPTSADNFLIFHVELGAQVTAAHCIVEDATSATIEFEQCDVAGDNCTVITTAMVCDVGGQADDGVIDAPDLDVDDWVRMDVTATTGTPGHVTGCITFTMDD